MAPRVDRQGSAVVASGSVDISSRVLARNSLLNLVGQALPLLVGVVTIPVIVRSMGAERFGLLSLAWVILGYFTIFDLGLGRATTKYVAEALGAGDRQAVPQIVWTAAATQGALGILGALVLGAVTPLLVARVLKAPGELLGDATAMLYVLAASIPVVLLSASFSGVLEAAQRFDLVNAVRVPSSILVFLVPLLGSVTKLDLPAIVGLIVLARFAALTCLWVLAMFTVPTLRQVVVSRDMFTHLLGFGGWVTVTSLVGPILVYFDRFMVASLVSMAAVAFYSAPYEAVTRLWIIPASLTAALYPAFSGLAGTGDRQRAARIFARSLKYVLLGMSPVILALVLFAQEILRNWLGPMFAERSAIAMQILAVGVLVNSLAHVPFSFLQGAGRPDVPAKFHLMELPFYIAISWVFVARWGIAGAAAAWTTRVLVDAFLLFVAAWRIGRLRWLVLKSARMPATWGALVGFGAVAYVGREILDGSSLALRLFCSAVVLASFGWAVWTSAFDDGDRRVLMRLLKV